MSISCAKERSMPTNTLTVTDNRTGKSYDLPVQDGCIRAADLRQVKVQADEFGTMSYDPAVRNLQILRLIGKMPTLAAYAYRHSLGLPYVYPDNDLSYTENFLNMLWRRTEPKYSLNRVLARALDVVFILHADHEQNCS